MALTRLTPRAAAPITLDQVKAHCRIDGSTEDALLAVYIQAAVDHVEGNRGVLGRALLNQAWELTYDEFPDGALQIPLGPLVSVTSVEYIDDATGTETLWDAANYVVDTASWEGWIKPVDAWPVARETMNAVKVTFVAGHGTSAAECPADIKMLLLHLVGHWYENREAVSFGGNAVSLPLTFDSLVSAIRKVTI